MYYLVLDDFFCKISCQKLYSTKVDNTFYFVKCLLSFSIIFNSFQSGRKIFF